MNYDFMIEYLG